MSYDALLLVSFGGPEKPEDVLPFLENVLRGRNVPRERMLEVAEHYDLFGGVSPLGSECRALLASLVAELNAHGPQLPVYWGNRNWHPLLADTLREMADDGVQQALALVTSAFGSYSGCRQYLEDIRRAREEVGPDAPRVDKLRLFYNHPGFIEPMAQRVAAALRQVPEERRSQAAVLFTAHSIPLSMAATSPYQRQVEEACRLTWAEVAARDPELQLPQGTDGPDAATPWRLVYQSRSGRPGDPWLEPDLCDHLAELGAAQQARDVVVAPIGFIAEHMEVVYDLDTEAAAVCEHFGLNFVRAGVVGNHPRFVTMIRELIQERIDGTAPRLALGDQGPWPDECPDGCCGRSR